MFSIALAGSAFLMGAAGSLHCAAMCVAPCAAVTAGRACGVAAFQAGRLIGYAAGGALVAASVGGLLRWEAGSGAARPLWLVLQLAVLALGAFLLWRGEAPRWVNRFWTLRAPAAVGIPVRAMGGGGVALSPVRTAASGLAGLCWLAWPCGLLQSALTVAALAEGPWQGAAVMAAFAAGSSPGLLAGPWLLRRLGGKPGGTDKPGGGDGRSGGPGVRFATRLSGGMLAAGALWALGHGVWAQIRAYCG